VEAAFPERLAFGEVPKKSDLITSCFLVISALNVFGLLCSPVLYPFCDSVELAGCRPLISWKLIAIAVVGRLHVWRFDTLFLLVCIFVKFV
jgi:hypothetical protein